MTKIVIGLDEMKVLKNLMKLKKGKISVPIYEYFLIETLDNNRILVHFYAGNLGVYVSKEFPAKVEGSTGVRFLSPINLIKEIKGGTKGQTYTFELVDDFSLKFNHSTIKKTITIPDHEEYPKPPRVENLKTMCAFRSDTLKSLEAALISASDSESRPILTTICIREDKLFTTDSHRLYATAIDGRVDEGDIIIPSTIAYALTQNENGKGFFGVVRQNEHDTVIETMDTIYYTQTVPGNYPDISRLIVDEPNYIIRFTDVKQLKTILEACYSLVKKERNEVVKLELTEQGTIIFTSKTSEEKVSEELSIELRKGEPGGLKMSFSCKYILDALRQIDEDEVFFNIHSALRPFIVRGSHKDTLAMVLPVRTY